jgi:hypothetical protein
MFGSFQISQMTFRPAKCLAAAPAHFAKAATLSGFRGEAMFFSALPEIGFVVSTVSS